MEKSLATQPNAKVSVVIAAYNASRTISQTLDNLLSQTYKNLEIIVVDDGSSDNTPEVVKSYQSEHKNVKLIVLKENSGPFRARIIGADSATGDYLHVIDADDYLSIDFYRVMVDTALRNKSDMVIGSVVFDFKNDGTISSLPLINDLPFHSLTGPEAFNSFMDQGGFNFVYHMNSTKFYSIKLWRKARPYYDWVAGHLIMADDLTTNIPLWYFTKRLDRAPTATLFYVKDDNDSATSNYQISYDKMSKNLSDLQVVFDFFQRFLESHNIYEQHERRLTEWKKAFVRVYHNNILASQMDEKEQTSLLDRLSQLAEYVPDEWWLDTPFFSVNAPWRGGLEELKKSITQSNIATIVFDFDSLILTVPLADGTNHYKVRETGQELYRLATYLQKKIRIVYTDASQEKALTRFFKEGWKVATQADNKKGSLRVSLPRPLGMFIDHGFARPLQAKSDNSSQDTISSLTHILANYYFDNPYISLVTDSPFNGRPTLLGYYSMGKDKSITELLSIPGQLDPYESYTIRALRLGITDFTTDAEKISLSIDSMNVLAWADRQLVEPLLYKHPQLFRFIARGPSSADHLHSALLGKRKVTKFVAYLVIDRGLVIGSLKKHVNRLTKNTPAVNKVLKKTYGTLRSVKRRIKK